MLLYIQGTSIAKILQKQHKTAYKLYMTAGLLKSPKIKYTVNYESPAEIAVISVEASGAAILTK